jgi:hypothetical protein
VIPDDNHRSAARTKHTYQGRRGDGLPDSGGDEAERNPLMPAEMVLGREELGSESSRIGLQPGPGVGQCRLQRGEGQSKIALDRPIVSDQVVRQPGTPTGTNL